MKISESTSTFNNVSKASLGGILEDTSLTEIYFLFLENMESVYFPSR